MGIVVVVALYTIAAVLIWRTWPLVSEIPGFIVERMNQWTYRTQLQNEERAFLKAFARADDEERKRLTIAQIRVHLTALGMDVSDFTDDEIEGGTMRFAETLASTGLTAEEAGRNIARALAVTGSR